MRMVYNGLVLERKLTSLAKENDQDGNIARQPSTVDYRADYLSTNCHWDIFHI